MNHYVFEALHIGAVSSIIIVGVYGLFCVILLLRQIRRRQFRNDVDAANFVNQISELFHQGRYEEAEELCASPEYWYVAVPWLTRTAIGRRHLGLTKMRDHAVAQFGREILTSMESLIASVNVVIKAEPMLGLFGTVLGMIGAFTEIASTKNPSPQDLMGKMSVALNCTALGLMAAIPLLLVANFLQVRMRKMEEEAYGNLQAVLEELDESQKEMAR